MPKPVRRNIHRYDRPGFQGWGVLLMRAGREYSRYFPDQGDRDKALTRARRWHAKMLDTLPPPRRIKRRFSRNTTGFIGIHLREDRTRSGQVRLSYGATWYDPSGRQRKRLFAVGKYGKRRALTLAIQARKEALASLLRPQRAPSIEDLRDHRAAIIRGRLGRRHKPFS